MDNVQQLPDRGVIEEEAARWLVRLDSDNLLAPKELQSLREWMQRSAAHRNELISLTEFWSDQSLAALPIPLEKLCDVTPTRDGKEHWFGWEIKFRTVAVAALLIVGLSITLLQNIHLLPSLQFPWGGDSNLYAAAIGQHKTIKLADGSVAYLNTNSQIKVDYGKHFRNIHILRGEAYFEVEKQAGRPFRVYAGRARVQAIGTAFTVYYRNNEDVDVTVAEGVVGLAMLAAETKPSGAASFNAAGAASSEPYLAIPVDELGVLESGKETTILVAHESQGPENNKLDPVKDVGRKELKRRGAWRSGLLVFSGNTLEKVVEEIGRYTTLTISIVDPELKAVRVGGRFSMENTGELFNALEANFNLKVVRLDYNKIEISSAKKI